MKEQKIDIEQKQQCNKVTLNSLKESDALTFKEIIHEGKYSTVQIAWIKSRQKIAVKKSINNFLKKSNELKYMIMLKHVNIVQYLCSFPSYLRKKNITYENILMECMPMSLYDYIESTTVVPRFEIKLYTYQILRGLNYMHNMDLCHGNVTTENILLNPKTGIAKLCDFKTTKNLSENEKHVAEIGTLSVCAPELLLNASKYTNKIDIWSIGCVFAEMVNGLPVFNGNTKQLLIDCIINLLGTPSYEQLKDMNVVLPQNHQNVVIRAKTWNQIFRMRAISEDIVSICDWLFCYSPNQRISARVAMTHNFFDELRSISNIYLPNGEPLPQLFTFTLKEVANDEDLFDKLMPEYAEWQNFLN